GRPGKTAERFVPDPFSTEAPGARLYRSGDLARRWPTGEIEFVGRVDGQLKVRGVRLELGEIEVALLAHPGVREAAVVARRSPAGALVLTAYAVPWPGKAGLTAVALRAFLRERLPEVLVPTSFGLLDALPLTRNGKVDRRALAALDTGRASVETPYVAPRSPVEARLAELFAEVLELAGVVRVGAEDGFFALGGHSLQATQLVARVSRDLAVELPLRTIFEHSTVAALAREVEAAREEGRWQVHAVPAERDAAAAERDGRPLSFAQQRLWFLDRLEPGTSVYNLPNLLRVEGRLEPAILARILAELARRHDVLRTRFPDVEGRPLQVLDPPGPVPLPWIDLAGLPAASRERELSRLLIAESLRPFDLARGPLLRARVVRIDREDWAVFFNLHHIISDGWSTAVLVREVGALYEAQLLGRPAALPPLPIQYADYAEWQRERLAGAAMAAELAWWREHLAGAPAWLPLPTDRPRPAVANLAGGAREAMQGLANAVETFCREQRV
ncbi:MAG TPA: condensation domain-containing protein, partial [Thermoanaerobaculia bacterium]